MSRVEEVAVRLARLEDYEGVCALMEVLDGFHRARLPWMFQAPAEAPRSEAWFEDLLGRADSAVFVADAGCLVGVAVGCLRAAPELPVFVQQRWGVLDGLVVDPAWRRRGVGMLLARSVEGWAVGAGAAWVEVNVYAANPEARRFYEALGYLPLSMKLRLGGAG